MRLSVLFAGILLICAYDARAEFFRYKDSSGAVVITDKLENVPKKYRNQLKVVWDEELEARDPLKKREAAASAAYEKREQEQKQRKAAEKKKPGDGKTLVITVDEETGQVIKRFE